MAGFTGVRGVIFAFTLLFVFLVVLFMADFAIVMQRIAMVFALLFLGQFFCLFAGDKFRLFMAFDAVLYLVTLFHVYELLIVFIVVALSAFRCVKLRVFF